ncbi:MAG: DUF2806 domain-containing protein [Planctomycetes bacterium]|nr:DUF2806 domain-containing protein [Planctomycetota bacterium]
MGDGFSMINLGELSKPATALVKRISDAVGGLCRPWQIKRVAEAEAQAAVIRAQSDIEVTDLQRRALERFLEEEARKQENMEAITRNALPLLEESARPSDIDNDWIVNFFDKCRLVSDSEMRALWSRVLAQESNAPGHFSKRTVNFVSTLEKDEATLFTSLCQLCWMVGNLTPLVFNFDDDQYRKRGITFLTLKHLDSIGLISFDAIAGTAIPKLPDAFTVFYYGEPTVLETSRRCGDQFSLGHATLTETGKELAVICGSAPDPEFQEYIRAEWRKKGYVTRDANGQVLTDTVAGG